MGELLGEPIQLIQINNSLSRRRVNPFYKDDLLGGIVALDKTMGRNLGKHVMALAQTNKAFNPIFYKYIALHMCSLQKWIMAEVRPW